MTHSRWLWLSLLGLALIAGCEMKVGDGQSAKDKDEEEEEARAERHPGEDPESDDGIRAEAHLLERDRGEEDDGAGDTSDPEQAPERQAGAPAPPDAPHHVENPVSGLPPL